MAAIKSFSIAVAPAEEAVGECQFFCVRTGNGPHTKFLKVSKSPSLTFSPKRLRKKTDVTHLKVSAVATDRFHPI